MGSGFRFGRRRCANDLPRAEKYIGRVGPAGSGLEVHPDAINRYTAAQGERLCLRAPVKSVTELLGLPDPPKTGRERLVAAAIELFYRNGFGAVGIDQVISTAGVTKTTFYKHFEGKDDLMVAAVERRDEWESVAWERAVRKLAGDDPAGQLLAVIDVLDAVVQRAGVSRLHVHERGDGVSESARPGAPGGDRIFGCGFATIGATWR